MAIAVRGTPQFAKANNGSNVTLTLDTITPAQTGDIVVVWGGHGDAVTTLTTPSGDTSGNYQPIATHTGSTPIFGAWYQVMGATPDLTITGFGSGNNADATAYGCFVLSGVDTSTPQDATATTAGPTTSTNPDPASITTTTANAWVVPMVGSAVSDPTVTGPSGYSNTTGTNGNDTNDLTAYGATFLNVGADAENPGTFGIASGTWYAITAAFREASGGLTIDDGLDPDPLITTGQAPTVGIDEIVVAGNPDALIITEQTPAAAIDEIIKYVPRAQLELYDGVGLLFGGLHPTISISGGGGLVIDDGLDPDPLITTGQAPTVGIDEVVVAGNPDALITSGQLPKLDTTIASGLGPDALITTGQTPVPGEDHLVTTDLSPDALITSGQLPKLDTTIASGLGLDTLITTGQQPTVGIAEVVVAGSPDALTFGGDASVASSGINIQAGNPDALVFGGDIPVANEDHLVDTDLSPDALTFGGDVPLIFNGRFVSPTTRAVSLAGQQPVTVAPREVTAGNPDGLATTGQVPLVRGGIPIPGRDVLRFQSFRPVVQSEPIVIFTPRGQLELYDGVGLIFRGLHPTISISGAGDHTVIAGNPDALITTGQVPVVAIDEVVVAGSPDDLITTGQQPTAAEDQIVVAGNPDALITTGQQPTVGIAEVVVAGNPDALILSGQTPQLEAIGPEPTTKALTLSGQAPVVSLGLRALPTTLAVSINGVAPTTAIQHEGTWIGNANATTDAPSNYEQCDYTGFRQLPGSLKLTWNKHAVRSKSWEERHPQLNVRSAPERKRRGPKRPEPEDIFLSDNEVKSDDL